MKLFRILLAPALLMLAGCVTTYPYETAFSSCDAEAGACYRYCEEGTGGNPAYTSCHAECEAAANQCFASAYDRTSYAGSSYGSYYSSPGWPWYGQYGAWGPSSGYYFGFSYWGGDNYRPSRRHRYYDPYYANKRKHRGRDRHDRYRGDDHGKGRDRHHGKDRDRNRDRRHDWDRDRNHDRGRDRHRRGQQGGQGQRPPRATPPEQPAGKPRLTPRQRRYEDARPSRPSQPSGRRSTPPPSSSPPASPPKATPAPRARPAKPAPKNTPRSQRSPRPGRTREPTDQK